MKKYILLIAGLFPVILSFSQSAKETAFRSAVTGVIKAVSAKDSTALSRYVQKGKGVIYLYRTGVFDEYQQIAQVSFTDPLPPAAIISESAGILTPALQYSTLPKYNCETGKWNKKGLFTDTLHVSHLLSRICKDRNKYDLGPIPASEINSYYALENKSRRVVVVDKNKKELVFYLSWTGQRWYLTILDFVTTDCSA